MVASRKEKNSLSIKVFALVFAMYFPGVLYSQTDSIEYRFKEAMGKTLALNVFGSKRTDINFAFSSIVLLFSKKGAVEEVLFSRLPDCLSGIRPKLEGDLKASIKNLGLPQREFSNKLVLIILTIKAVSQPPTPSVFFEKVFDDIDGRIFRDKEVKYLFSMTIDEMTQKR